MSLNTLLESANPYHSLQSDAAKLANKWEKTGLLEGLEDVNRNNMSMILENQAKQLVVESSQTGGGVASQGNFTAGIGGQWAGVALPLVRKVFGQIASKEFVSVQPMNLPSGLVFFLDFLYGTEKTPFTNGQSVYGNTGSVDFETTVTGGLYGPGRFTYSINNTESLALTGAAPSVATWKDMNYDSNYSASFGDYRKHTIDFDGQNADFEGVLGFRFASSSGGAAQLTFAENLPQFNSASANRYVSFIALATDLPGGANAARAGVTASFQLQPTDQYRGDFEDGNLGLNNNNNPISIPEVNVQMKSLAIVAKTRKLKAVWTPEFAQDLNAYHALDAEAELTSILSEYISLEIDLEILEMLMENAGSGTLVWSAKNNIDRAHDAAGTETNLGFYNSQGQWFQT